jgi:hypothetical protein
MDATYDEMLDLLEEWQVTLDDDEFEATVRKQIDSLAPGAPGRAQLLYSLGSQCLRLEDRDGALVWFERAAEEPGEVIIDPRRGTLQGLLEDGRNEEADALERELRRSSAAGDYRGFFHEPIAVTLEMNGRQKAALRWFSIGVLALDPDDPTAEEIGCLNGRYRIRRSLDLPMDQLDLIADEVNETHYRTV